MPVTVMITSDSRKIPINMVPALIFSNQSPSRLMVIFYFPHFAHPMRRFSAPPFTLNAAQIKQRTPAHALPSPAIQGLILLYDGVLGVSDMCHTLLS